MKLLLLFAILGAATAGEQAALSAWWWWPFGDSTAPEPHWNTLKVGWGINPLTSFQTLPRTRSEAVKQGWTMYGRATCADTICTVGRTAKDFETKGTGSDLYLQTGASPRTDFVIIPKYEKDLEGTDWTPGKCFWTMGMHYFKNLRENMRCEELYPLFPLYNNGKLNAFGMLIGADIPSPTSRYESPIASKTFYQLFMTPVPKCLQSHTEEKGVTTLHVFLENDPRMNNFC
ncbi:Hypp1871 [Branchiostoma lanceolatum]|uniref:Hypp1871 protein n=1 Tax=Branchiostoma lanceolatum TaxID=7740 RepID=A0A8J9ZNV9_BRALA|nr:Hypp1871 [Branchiostoma lanceolatum]